MEPLCATYRVGFPEGRNMCCGTRPSPATPITRQGGWRRCKKCEGMFYGETSRGGKCPAGGAHDKSESGNYLVTQNTPDDSGQHYWRWCNKCQGMFYAGHGTGTCSSGGGHDDDGSGDYSLAQNVGESGVGEQLALVQQVPRSVFCWTSVGCLPARRRPRQDEQRGLQRTSCDPGLC